MKPQKGKVATGKSSTALPAVIDTSKYLTLYRDMSTAIASCHAIDECKDIADKSHAMAAYYKQASDTETERMFYQIKLRAWRRIGEIFAAVDVSDCHGVRATEEKIKAHFKGTIADGLSDGKIMEILRLHAVSDKDFEFALKRMTTGNVATLLQKHTPQALARLKREQKLNEEHRLRRELAWQKKHEEERPQREMQDRHLNELAAAAGEALKEVGITLERKDRIGMKQVVFLIKDEVHAVMRQAAFDQKITMQEVLRRGLKMWLIAHDYEFPDDAVGTTVSRIDARAAR